MDRLREFRTIREPESKWPRAFLTLGAITLLIYSLAVMAWTATNVRETTHSPANSGTPKVAITRAWAEIQIGDELKEIVVTENYSLKLFREQKFPTLRRLLPERDGYPRQFSTPRAYALNYIKVEYQGSGAIVPLRGRIEPHAGGTLLVGETDLHVPAGAYECAIQYVVDGAIIKSSDSKAARLSLTALVPLGAPVPDAGVNIAYRTDKQIVEGNYAVFVANTMRIGEERPRLTLAHALTLGAGRAPFEEVNRAHFPLHVGALAESEGVLLALELRLR